MECRFSSLRFFFACQHHVLTIGSLVHIPHSRWQSPNPAEWYVKGDIFSRLLHHSVREPTSGKDKWTLCHKTPLILFFFFSLHLRMRALVPLICFTLASLKHFTRDTNPQNGFVTWSLHSSSPFHSNKRIISQSSQNFLTILPKKKKKKKETKIALFHFLRAHYESMVDGGGNGNLFRTLAGKIPWTEESGRL